MAEAIILPLANSILKMIASFTGGLVMEYVGEEIQAFKSVREDLKAIAEDLESITSVLQDAEAKQYGNAAMKIWLRDLKSVVYDIDDLLDEVATDALQRSLTKGHFFPRLGYYLSLKPLISHFDFSHKIKALRLQLERIVVKKNKFGLTDRPLGAPSIKRDAFDSCGYVNDLEIVGRDEAKKDIISRVLSLRNESSLSVLPIVGMGGIGKTALAKLVYADVDQYDIKLWVCVSDKFDIKKVLQNILKAATRENTTSYSLGDSVEKLQDKLKSKKFFLVLDDLWEDDIGLWRRLKNILAVGGNGSTILITTRIKKVASITQTVEPYNLEKLSELDCWRLFKNFAFADGEEKTYPRLRKIGKSIVKKCCGIPLAVQSLGSLLRNEKDEGEWLRIKNIDNLNQLDNEGYNRVNQLLKLSYDKLPAHLKPCFAHLSLFAKDTVYFPYYHSYCWGALGLLQQHDGSYFEHNLFSELLSRSMIQDVGFDYLTNIIDTFKIHDLLHDLAGGVLGEELAIVTENKRSISDSSRYIGWGLSSMSDKDDLAEQLKFRKARTFSFLFNISVSQAFLEGVISNMPCLRILNLGVCKFKELPSSIGNLKHLRVLDLSGNVLIESLPNTICALLNLQCLLLDGCLRLQNLPTKMYKLTSLRFLSLTTRQETLVGTNFNRLPSLRHILLVSCKKLVSLWDSDDIGQLTSLHSLYIFNCPKLASLPNSMKQIVGLKELFIDHCGELDLGRGYGLHGLQSIKTLAIKGVPEFSYLPISIKSASSSLKHLSVGDCPGFSNFPSWMGSFSSLERLVIVNCHNLLFLPEEIRHLNSLQYLNIENCTHISWISLFSGRNSSLIRHIPEIWHNNRRLTPKSELMMKQV